MYVVSSSVISFAIYLNRRLCYSLLPFLRISLVRALFLH